MITKLLPTIGLKGIGIWNEYTEDIFNTIETGPFKISPSATLKFKNKKCVKGKTDSPSLNATSTEKKTSYSG